MHDIDCSMAGQDRAGQAGQGRAGQGRAGQGRAGQETAEQGRENNKAGSTHRGRAQHTPGGQKLTVRAVPVHLALAASVQQFPLGVCITLPPPHPVICLKCLEGMFHSSLWQKCPA